MKRLVLSAVCFLVTTAGSFAANTEFYTQSGGNNLNAGSTTNNTAAYTSAGGNWANATRTFTPTDGSNPSASVSVGDFCSVYVTAGATVAGYLARATTVTNATNGTIIFSSTSTAGSNPSNGTGTMTCKCGGAWKGPNAATLFPIGVTSLGALTNTNGDWVRVNLKNDASYSLTSNIVTGSISNYTVQGYSSTVGDGGKALITINTTGSLGIQIVLSGGPMSFLDIIWENTGASLTNTLMSSANAGAVFIRNVWRGARSSGISVTGTPTTFYECEWYDDNKANGSGQAALLISSGLAVCVNGYSHDHTSGTNADAYRVSAGSLYLFNSIADTAAGNGVTLKTTSTGGVLQVFNSNFYNNTGDAINIANTAAQGFDLFVNNNFTKNSGKAINNTTGATAGSSGVQAGIIYNNGRGSGTEANGGSDVLGSIVNTGTDVTYASNVEPYTAPTTGNFSTNLAAAEGTARGHFEQNDGTNTGTVGFPDIGAAQANIGCPYPTPTYTPTSTPTPTATATATFTPCAPTPTATSTFTPTATPTATSTATATSTPTPSATAPTYSLPSAR